jgi:chemotaxis signal transduction protein
MGENKSRGQTKTVAAEAGAASSGGPGQSEKYLLVSIIGKLYAVRSTLVGEVAALEQVYPLPLLPPYFLGLINRYSVPYALIDLGCLITGARCATRKVIVLKQNVDRVAFLIEDIVDIVDIDPSIARKVSQEGADSDFEAVESSFEWQQKDVFVLNVSAVISRIKADQER